MMEMEESRITPSFLNWSIGRMDLPSNWVGKTLEKQIKGWTMFIILI